MILVSGYYGYGNLGDEAVLAALCQDLLALGISRQEIVVPSGNPKQTTADHGVAAVGRFDLKEIWRILGSARCLISGGGSLLQDVTSKRSIPYYLTLVEMALLRKVPVVMYGQGLGPIWSKPYQAWTARAYRQAASCSVRDEASLGFLKDLGVDEDKVLLAADPVFSRAAGRSSGYRAKKLLLNLRPYSRWEAQKGQWLAYLRGWQQRGWTVEFAPLGPGDEELGRALEAGCPELRVHPKVELGHVDSVFQGAALCISMRLHGVIFSVLNDCQPVAVSYDPKVEAVSSQLKTPYIEVEGLEGLNDLITQVLLNSEEMRTEYQRSLADLRRRAEHNRKALAQVLR
ncbi:MAG TPA: polysaccharide pyruvyl transferase CsaB [Firmicutes bacterium]|nr:polysaccharide pyruvyl transferase CsaB [Bacillota bacterium]HHT43007.1 polysaccharide pyruvyl transferase CsaB [Bacillota bacterium]